MDRRVYIVRHGDIINSHVKRYIGETDIHLSEKGIAQAMRLKEFFKNTPLEVVYISSLTRCIQTSNYILENRNVKTYVLDELKEIHMGAWENQTFESIKERFSQEYDQRGRDIVNYAPPGGESFIQVYKRVVPVVDRILGTTDGNVLIVGHAGVNRVILNYLLKNSLEKILSITQPYGCINELQWNSATDQWEFQFIDNNILSVCNYYE